MLLVTGITGHTGRYFLQELINNKYEGLIRCVVRETSDTTLIDNSGLNIEKVVGSIDNREFIDKAMADVDVVMHIYNIHHSPMIVEASIMNNVKRAILVHTTGIYSQFKYASEGYRNIEKKVSELTKDSKCPTSITVLRPSMIYGDLCDSNMSKFIKMIDKFRVFPVINKGESLLQPVNARDLGKAFYNVLMSPKDTTGKAYNLSGEKPIKMIDVFKLINKELNKNTKYISVPLSFGVIIARVFRVLTLRKIDFVEQIQRMGEDRSYSHNAASRDFGYSPIAFEVGLQIEVQEYKQKIKEKR